MKTPTLEEVKEYFKNAKEVRCVNFKRTYLLENGFYKKDTVGIAYEFNEKDDYIRLYSFKNGYAEIISYKDTYTVSKDFILEAHESACSTWKTKIENQFPELFPKVELELNKWYKTTGDFLVFVTKELKDNSEIGFGFDGDDKWTNNWHYYTNNKLTLATKQEVETALIAEAKKRGFKNGAKFKSIDFYLNNVKIIDDFLKFDFYSNDLYLKVDAVAGQRYRSIFLNGKWAEIISEPIELSLEERVRNIEEQLKQLK